ncbi:MAG TPA: hypothetical protein VK726_05085 [Acetobacteraceae bacterium]|nr:hypothetical protein [Acetobacteraceae bacterium]
MQAKQQRNCTGEHCLRSCVAGEHIGGLVRIFRVVVYVLASWLIAAHFLRADEPTLVALCLATPLLFLLRRTWSMRLLQGLTYAAGVIWLLTAWQIVSLRRAFDQPWLLSAAILLGVAAISVVAGLLLRSRPVPNRHAGRWTASTPRPSSGCATGR